MIEKEGNKYITSEVGWKSGISSRQRGCTGTLKLWSWSSYHQEVKEGCVVWTSLGPLPRWVPGPTTWWDPGTTRLALHGTWWREAQGLHRRSTLLGSCTCPTLYGRLLDVLD
jgi:hypothetical protein